MKLLLKPITTKKITNLKKFSHTRPNHRFCLAICCLLSSRHFGSFSVKFLLNRTTAQKMTNLQKSVRRLIIIFLSLSYGSYYQSFILELVRYTSRLTPLLNKRCSICKILLHLYESSFLPRFLVLCIRTTFCSSYVKILAEPNCGPENGQFIKHWHTPLNNHFQLDLWCLPSERHFKTLTVKLSLNAITTQKIADFQNSFTCHRIIVFI